VTEARWLDEGEQRAWLGYRRMRLLLDAQIARDLAADSGLSLADYDVLSTLGSAEDRRGRSTEIASRMLWSKSRLSRQLARMELRGLVKREQCPADGRGSDIVLTDKGLETIMNAAPGHVDSVRAHVIDLLSSDQIRALGDMAEIVLSHLGDIAASAGRLTESQQARLPDLHWHANGRPDPPPRGS
jgi:DNA-binding MarR family transcriptional regulator